MNKIKNFLKFLLKLNLSTFFAILMFTGILQLFTFSLSIYTGNFTMAGSSPAANYYPGAWYNEGLLQFKNKNNYGAIFCFQKAFNACYGQPGSIEKNWQKLASDCQFKLGICYDKVNQTDKALDAYIQSMRFDPNNLFAKYNYEQLLHQHSPQDDGGNNSADEQGNSQAQSDSKSNKPSGGKQQANDNTNNNRQQSTASESSDASTSNSASGDQPSSENQNLCRGVGRTSNKGI